MKTWIRDFHSHLKSKQINIPQSELTTVIHIFFKDLRIRFYMKNLIDKVDYDIFEWPGLFTMEISRNEKISKSGIIKTSQINRINRFLEDNDIKIIKKKRKEGYIATRNNKVMYIKDNIKEPHFKLMVCLKYKMESLIEIKDKYDWVKELKGRHLILSDIYYEHRYVIMDEDLFFKYNNDYMRVRTDRTINENSKDFERNRRQTCIGRYAPYIIEAEDPPYINPVKRKGHRVYKGIYAQSPPELDGYRHKNIRIKQKAWKFSKLLKKKE